MNYSLCFKEETIELPEYNLAIAEKIDKQDTMNISVKNKIKDRCQSMYNLITDLIGKDKITNVLGLFKDADPNEIMMLYNEITKAYRNPLREYTATSAIDEMQDSQLEKLVKMMEFIEKAQRIKL